MGIGLYDYERRRRNQFWSRFVRATVVLAVLALTSGFAYEFGQKSVTGHDGVLNARIAELEKQNQDQAVKLGEVQAATRVLEGRLAEANERYAHDVPTGDVARLTAAVRERLAAGIEPDRLAFTLSNTQNPRDCKSGESKRFILPIAGAGRGPSSAVSLASGAVTVTGQGTPMYDMAGNPLTWFDPGQPVTIRFVTQGGAETVAKGVLPLHQSLVVGDVEHRFTITSGARSLVEVTTDHCAYP